MITGLDLGNLLAHLRIDTAQYTAGLKGAEQMLVVTGQKMAATGRKMTMMVTAPLVAIGAIGVKIFVSFEEEMAMVSTMLDEQSMKYMPEYTQAVKSMAMEFGEGTKALTKGLYDILSASVAPAKAIDVLTVSVKAAKAGMTDAGLAADAITTILNAYGMAASEAAKVSDILFATVKRGKTTFAELAPTIGMVTAVAAIAGLELEQVGAALATLTRAGVRTRRAVTSLKAMIQTFIKPTEDGAKVAEEFGFQLSSATLQTIGLTGVLEKLRGATAEQLAGLMPNVRGLVGLAAALKQVEGMTSDYQLMLHSAGMTEEAFTKMTETMRHELSKTWQTIKILAVTIGRDLRPSVEAASKSIREFTKNWIDSREASRRWVAEMLVTAAVVGPLLLIGGKLLLFLVALKAYLLSAAGAAALVHIGLVVLAIKIRSTIITAIESYELATRGLWEVQRSVEDLTKSLEKNMQVWYEQAQMFKEGSAVRGVAKDLERMHSELQAIQADVERARTAPRAEVKSMIEQYGGTVPPMKFTFALRGQLQKMFVELIAGYKEGIKDLGGLIETWSEDLADKAAQALERSPIGEAIQSLMDKVGQAAKAAQEEVALLGEPEHMRAFTSLHNEFMKMVIAGEEVGNLHYVFADWYEALEKIEKSKAIEEQTKQMKDFVASIKDMVKTSAARYGELIAKMQEAYMLGKLTAEEVGQAAKIYAKQLFGKREMGGEMEGSTREINPRLMSTTGLAIGGGGYSRLVDVGREQVGIQKDIRKATQKTANKEGLGTN